MSCLSAPSLEEVADVFVSLEEQIWAEVEGMLRATGWVTLGHSALARALVPLVQLLPWNCSPTAWRSMPVEID